MDLNVKKELFTQLSKYITPNKLDKFDTYIGSRTRYITVVLEDIFQSHNTSAVLRTCECYGIQDIHVIENRNKYKINPDVALGASKWVNILKYNKAENNTRDCISHLKSKGYRIIATTPHTDDILLNDLSLGSPVALLFGTELEGLSDIALEAADEYVRIPMYGFTESLNISVSAAITIFTLTEKLRRSGIKYQLSEEEMVDIKLNWARSVVKKAEILEKNFLKSIQPGK